MMTRRLRLVALVVILLAGAAHSEPVAVRHTEGVVHGFLALRSLDGRLLADGDLSQVASGDRVTTKLTFHFKDGSRHEETAVFSQRGTFRLLSDHVVQQGPAFPHASDITIDAAKGEVKARRTGKDGKEEVVTARLALPADIANGLASIVMKNIPRDRSSIKMSVVAVTTKPHLADLTITREGEDRFSVAGSQRDAIRYRVNVRFRGASGVAATLLGKEPPDYHVWIMRGEAPVFLRSEGPLYGGGPAWRIELASPEWPRTEPRQ